MEKNMFYTECCQNVQIVIYLFLLSSFPYCVFSCELQRSGPLKTTFPRLLYQLTSTSVQAMRDAYWKMEDVREKLLNFSVTLTVVIMSARNYGLSQCQRFPSSSFNNSNIHFHQCQLKFVPELWQNQLLLYLPYPRDNQLLKFTVVTSCTNLLSVLAP